MELRQLRQFVAVAEELHFARAAERLHMEQSPLSQSIRKLEAELDVALFHRTTRRTWLTRAGSRFYAEVRVVLDAVERAKASVRPDHDVAARIALGLGEHAAGEPFNRFLFELEHRVPPIAVDLTEIAPADAARLLSDRILDCAMVLTPLNGSGLRSVRAWAEAFVLLAPLGHPLAERDDIALQELASEAVVMPHAASLPGYSAQLEDVLSRHGARSSPQLLAKHQNIMVSHVAAGRGFALLPESIAHGLTTVAVVPLSHRDAEIVTYFAYRDGEVSDAIAFALEIAALIDRHASLPSDAPHR